MSEFVLVILLFAAAAGLTAAGMLVLGWIVGPKRTGAVKEMPYESGMDPIHDARRRFDVRFHLVAIAFLVFDVELLFLYPWAVAARADTPVPVANVAQAAHEAGELSTADSPADAPATTRTFADQPVDRRLVFGGVMFFLALVVLGLVYEWKKGILQWR
jgi:NADH-quinone oxidoreductase subunit A